MNKYYLAYGSNLSMAQMAQRCPDAVYVGTAELKDYQLLFKGSQSGSYLTVEPKKGSMVPVLVWRISERDEHYLDRYEGYPSFYYKKTMEVEVQSFIGEKTDDVKTNNKRGIGNRGKTKIVVKEHFSEKGKTMEELLTDVMLEKAKQTIA